MSFVERTHGAFHLHGTDGMRAQQPLGPFQHFQIVSLRIDLEEIDPRDRAFLATNRRVLKFVNF